MATSEILPFGSNGSGTPNVLTQANYVSFLATLSGNSYGDGALPSAKQFNKILRQPSFVSAALSQWMVDKGQNVFDDGNISNFVTAFIKALLSTSSSALYTANGSFTVPDGVTTIFISGSAGGGGGGGSGSSNISSAASSAGGGGGAGQGIIDNPFTVTPGQTIAITIGAGGVGGNASNTGVDNATAGTSGGNTVIGSLITLIGGSGGGKGNIAVAGTVPGPIGGNGYPKGGTSPDGGITGGFIYSGVSGIGASSIFGGGGCPSRASSGASLDGSNGHGYGSGGSGGGAVYNNTLSGAFGGNAAPGFVLVRW